MFQYDNAELKVNGTSGAPILNAEGQVVGINLAAMQDNQKFIGVAHPVERFVLQLRTATKEIAFKLQQSRPDPKADATATKTPGQPEPMPDPVMIGQSINLGKVGIQAENYWAEEIGAGEETYNASFIATLTNAGDQAMSLPSMEVTLVDAEGRQFKSSKAKQGATGVLNPLMKSRNFWAFTLPAQGTMKYAQFKNKDGVVRVDLSARTPENAAHIVSEEHIALLQESMLFASPRVAVKIQYDKAKKLMDDAEAEVTAGEMEMARIEKAIDKATAAVESAKVPLEKARKTSEAALEKVKFIKANWDTLPQRTRVQQQAKADQDLERALRQAGEATDNFKDKEAVVKELGKELKEAERVLKPLRTKFETQQKAVQALEQKL
jgi:hypothetical protein